MSSRKFHSGHHLRPFSAVIKNCFGWTQTTPIQSNPSYIPKSPAFLSTDLINSYFQKGLMQEARTLFDEMPEKDVVAWTTMITGYASRNNQIAAWNVFRDMLRSNVRPNAYSVSSVLKACKGMKRVFLGGLVHGYSMKCGILGFIYVDNGLLDMYGSCCVTMKEACEVFGSIEVKNEVSWTSLISGFTHRGLGRHALQIFRQMLEEEGECNPYSLSIAVRACASTGSQKYGKQVWLFV
ncbi:Tetratricopeptide repeat (TPR)-like superfamily protein [Euphorbia peplus]|nr:Tetratricopeptide repeat (TPR)-like superfamily protein [Euphorbia peplus]